MLYQRVGIPDYRVVDIDHATIEPWTPAATAPEIQCDTVHWHPVGAGSALRVDIPALFAPI